MVSIQMCDQVMGRKCIRAIKCELLAQNIQTTMRVERGQLVLKGKLTDSQRELAKAHKEELVWYLTTPPEQRGTCGQCKRPIEWMCTEYGDWLCSCYRSRELAIELAKSRVKRILEQ